MGERSTAPIHFFGVLSPLATPSLRRFTEGALLSEGSQRRIAGPLLNDEIDIALNLGADYHANF